MSDSEFGPPGQGGPNESAVRSERVLREFPLVAAVLVAVLAALLPALGFGALAAYQAAEANAVVATGRLEDSVQSIALSVDREISNIKSTMAALSTSTALDGDPPKLAQFEIEVRRASAVLNTSIVVLDAKDLRQLINTALPVGQTPRGVSAPTFGRWFVPQAAW